MFLAASLLLHFSFKDAVTPRFMPVSYDRSLALVTLHWFIHLCLVEMMKYMQLNVGELIPTDKQLGKPRESNVELVALAHNYYRPSK